MAASTEPTVPSVSSSTLPDTAKGLILRTLGPVRRSPPEFSWSDRILRRGGRRLASRVSPPVLPVRASSSGGEPRESLDAPDDLPKQAPRQVTLGQLEDEVPRMPDKAPAGPGSSGSGPAGRGSAGTPVRRMADLRR